jgi:hypothetical protein
MNCAIDISNHSGEIGKEESMLPWLKLSNALRIDSQLIIGGYSELAPRHQPESQRVLFDKTELRLAFDQDVERPPSVNEGRAGLAQQGVNSGHGY